MYAHELLGISSQSAGYFSVSLRR